MTTLNELDSEIRKCTKCAEILKNWCTKRLGYEDNLYPNPILSDPKESPIMLVGQAPGSTEHRGGIPFSGKAGDKIKENLAKVGLPIKYFDKLVYQTSIVKCYPGKHVNSVTLEERIPPRKMINNCLPFLEAQFNEIKPKLIIALGWVASRQLYEKIHSEDAPKLGDLVGTCDDWNGRKVIYLFHTSGSNRANNDEKNKAKSAEAYEILEGEISKILKSVSVC